MRLRSRRADWGGLRSVMSKRVLLAEDEPNIVISVSFLLERAGFAVDVCENGRQAFEAAIADPPDVLVLDVMLPDMDGFEILAGLRGHAKVASLPILMLTAKGQREDRDRALALGADLFITKPFANADLTEAVKRLAHQAPVTRAPAK